MQGCSWCDGSCVKGDCPGSKVITVIKILITSVPPLPPPFPCISAVENGNTRLRNEDWQRLTRRVNREL